MRDEASVSDFSVEAGDNARLERRVDMVIREIARARQEREAEPVRAALIHLQAVHAAKRLRKKLVVELP